MTLDEARKVAEIASTADHRCGVCVRALYEKLAAAFPEFVWTYPVRVMVTEDDFDGEPMTYEDNGIGVEPRLPEGESDGPR